MDWHKLVFNFYKFDRTVKYLSSKFAPRDAQGSHYPLARGCKKWHLPLSRGGLPALPLTHFSYEYILIQRMG